MTKLSIRVSLLSSTLTVAMLAASVHAQSFNVTGVTNNRGFHQGSSDRNMVRFQGNLYAAVVLENGTVQIRRKAHSVLGGWSALVNVNTTSSGIGNSTSTSYPTTTVSMAGTLTGYLHITWGRYYYPNYFRQYYRCLRIVDKKLTHAVQDITSYVSSNSATRTDSMAIAVDAHNRVFLTAQLGTSSWRTQLLRSLWQNHPNLSLSYPQWMSHGEIGVSGSSKNVSMVADAGGRLHLGYYNNQGNGNYCTRIFRITPAGWYSQENIGVPPFPGDQDGYLAADSNGYTHVIYKHLVTKIGSTTIYQLRYRRRLGLLGWTSPLVVYTFTSTLAGVNTTDSSYALSAHGDRVLAIYRDYKTGRLMVKQRKKTENKFEFLSELRVGSKSKNSYWMPSVRNTLFPVGNRTEDFMDITWRYQSGTTFKLFHQRLHVGAMGVDKPSCSGPDSNPKCTVGGVPCSPGTRTVSIGLEGGKPFAPAFLLYTAVPTFSLPFGGCTLYANTILAGPMSVDACGNAKVTFPGLAPGGCTTNIYFQWAVLDSGWRMSNRGRLHL